MGKAATMTQLPADNIPSMARWLLARLERIRHHEAGAELYDEITSIVAHCWRQVDRPSDRIYLGPCGEGCDGELELMVSAGQAVCTECRRSASNGDLRAGMDDHLGTATEIARVLKMLGMQVTASAIRGYAHRRRLEERSTSPAGSPMYRIGDVCELLKPDTDGVERQAS